MLRIGPYLLDITFTTVSYTHLGYDNVDLDAATAHKVCVMNTPGQNSNAVAELVFGMLVYGVRNFYNGTSGTELKGKKLGILAYGNVGRNVARIAKGFGMEVYAYDAFCPASVIEADGVQACLLYTSSCVYETGYNVLRSYR